MNSRNFNPIFDQAEVNRYFKLQFQLTLVFFAMVFRIASFERSLAPVCQIGKGGP